MAKINQAVFDAGPVIHLTELNKQKCFYLFKKIFISKEVSEETKNSSKPKNFVIEILDGKHKDLTKIIAEKYELDLGEASSIALCRQNSIKLFFTDDLQARVFAKEQGIEVHGTIAILLRCFREKILSKEETIKTLKALKTDSSLFITADLIEFAVKEVKKF
ncbi:MAG: hypothetical protein COT90_00980 [Candidatus Diapherotrites archaeon CG10_big_fil_rev_8_21_14_0_10_31_34]|nr:MAG: hypothetical protein COT90_00980 [Candidatus Diapherotrites archaeon CG10_big_fil_rev_8_21_14_0_10_31_34]PJA19940.1 MAG: hypothetical protein COX63_01120 [Candidatus Diapherotrites archaeon CG_4_10_14_0_2_um_filter_31_5]